MGVASSAQELKSAIAPPPMFKALTLDANDFLSNPLPQFIKSLDRVLDAGGAGSVEQINFAEGSEYKDAKHKHQIDEVDEKNLRCKYAMIEGDALIDSLSTQLMRSNFEAVRRQSITIYIGNFEIKEEEIEAGEDAVTRIYKVVEKYIPKKPQVYT